MKFLVRSREQMLTYLMFIVPTYSPQIPESEFFIHAYTVFPTILSV